MRLPNLQLYRTSAESWALNCEHFKALFSSKYGLVEDLCDRAGDLLTPEETEGFR